MTHKILLVEDDAIIASGLVYALAQEGYDVIHCGTVGAARETLAGAEFSLAILDMQLPDGTGFDVRKLLSDTGIIFLTVVDDEGNIVRAFDGGADDYITKPFRLRELIARVKRTLAGRSGDAMDKHVVSIGAVKIDTSSGRVFANGQEITLTALEYRVLLTFAQNKGRLLTRNQILDSIWDSVGNFVEDNTLTVYVKRLREKLGDTVNIETVRGVGYRVGE